MNKLSHFDETGKIKMVDVSEKTSTVRRAAASGRVILSRETLNILKSSDNPKGDPLEIARIAGIMAAKKTPDLIPLCHQLNLSKVNVTAEIQEDGIYLTSEVTTNSQTGVEMEALTAVAIAALTIYDMVKAVDKTMVIGEVKLMMKSGGRSGTFRRR